MRIGLTYDLRAEYLAAGYSEEETAEFDRPDTIDSIERALRELGHATDRIGHVRQLTARLGAGDRWDLVFNIAEGLRGIAREAQVPALLDAFEIAYTFSDPLIMALSLHKGLTKLVVREAGVPTAAFAEIERIEDLLPFAPQKGALSRNERRLSELRYPLFAKPIAEGTGKGVTPASRIDRAEQLPALVGELLARFKQPVLVEEYLPGREFTVGLVGTGERAEVLGTLEIVLLSGAEPHAYSYVNKEKCEDLVEYRLVCPSDPTVRRAEELALQAWRALGCRDAGRIDLRCDAAGEPSFLEVNPLAGLHPQHSDLPMLCTAIGMPYVELIRRITDSAATRAK